LPRPTDEDVEERKETDIDDRDDDLPRPTDEDAETEKVFTASLDASNFQPAL
jgi:hypothetical protein